MSKDSNRYAVANLDELEEPFVEVADEFIAEWEMNSRVGLVLAGPYGIGKSYAAAAILNYIRSLIKPRRWDTLYISSPKLYSAYYDITKKEHWDEYREQFLWETLEHVDVLVWNDLGKENRTGGYHDQVTYAFDKLLRERVERGLSTIFTTNLRLAVTDVQSIKASYGDGFWSLLHEAAPMRFELTGKDRRRK